MRETKDSRSYLRTCSQRCRKFHSDDGDLVHDWTSEDMKVQLTSGVMEINYQASIEQERCDSQTSPVSDRKGVSGNNAALQVRSEHATLVISSTKGTERFSQLCLIIKPYQSCGND